MDKYNLARRNISEAIYLKNHPFGDPFVFKYPINIKQAKLFGIGIGLYWGEGTKACKNAIRLGNTDPQLINTFLNFLRIFFNIKKGDLRFSLQIFSDLNEKEALHFWLSQLDIRKSQFYKTVITRSGRIGNYHHKSKYGVLTLYYHNKKARQILGNLLPE